MLVQGRTGAELWADLDAVIEGLTADDLIELARLDPADGFMGLTEFPSPRVVAVLEIFKAAGAAEAEFRAAPGFTERLRAHLLARTEQPLSVIHQVDPLARAGAILRTRPSNPLPDRP